MTLFYQELYKLVTEGLAELQASQEAGKTPVNPVSEAHYISAWVTKAIKQHRFEHCMAKTLMSWQQQARSMGQHAQLRLLFENLAETYAGVMDEQKVAKTITDENFTNFFSQVEQQDWQVTTEHEINRKVKHHTDGQASLVVCCKKFEEAFDAAEGQEVKRLVKPLSIFIRGNTQALIDAAFGNGLLLYKVTDYKSIVKYHGEYIIQPDNNGSYLPELPTRQ
ncbi:DUF2913 family protein [Photobacterium sanguinicancri]|uniref:DUF2913 domain-containing protein n=1 Tax=Photobacterium sanguinicancri TaxID=875932 RepID=A0ABX4FWB9_9GAMM|nr:DUF2913 family protein [Photobacterium sanguinicancri]OZS43086.1 hypothetical protein ASV53_15055 [Photobacterium sanguinicancri]